MATAVESLVRYTPSASTSPVQRWAQAMAAYKSGDSSITMTQVMALFRASGIPVGSTYGQYAMALMRSVSPELFLNGDQVNDLTRQIEQKPPVGSEAWAYAVNPVIIG